MKTIITLVLVAFSYLGFAQDEIKMPELDTENKVYVLKFSPDSKEKNVISAYMKGTTEADSLRFWAEGTHIPQNVMVTVLSRDKTKKIKVDIVKDHWEDVKRGGTTEDGIYQESFDTAGKFGIVLSSDSPKVPFDLAVWTSGEILPSYASLYVPISNESNSNSAQNNSNSVSNSDNKAANSNNYLLYAIIGLLAIIAALLGLKMFKNKGKAALIIIFLISSQQILFAQASQSLSSVFTQQLENSNMHPGVTDIGAYSAQIGMLASQDWTFDYLAPVTDSDAQPQMDDGAGPRLPSSCIPDRYRQETNRIDNNSTNPAEILSSGSPRNNNGNNSIGDGINSSNTSEDASSDTEEDHSNRDEKGRPKYDKEGNPINYDDSKYPKYNEDGKKIDYGDIKEDGDFDSKGRPKYDAKGDPIKYDNADRPKYDAKGDPINYPENNNNNDSSGFKDNPANEKNAIKTKSSKHTADNNTKKSTSKDGLQLAETLASDKIDALKVFKNITKNIQSESKISEASIFNIPALITLTNNQREEGCKCLEDVYKELNTRRLTLEKLRIIFSHSMKKINAGMAFGDNVSGVHGVSGLAWQSQKMIILKESIPTLNKAYDDKYAELIENLQKNLWEIDRCEKLLGYDDWYNHSGFIYYAFMRDKYSRN